jgi:uncharacterized repeat protein (TIGR01451 family)
MRIRHAALTVLVLLFGASNVQAQASADVSITKSGSPNPVNAGADVTYTIVVSNAGPSAAQTVSMSDPLPAVMTFVSLQQNSGPAFTLTSPPVGSTGTITATISTLGAGATATFTVVAHVLSSVPNGSVRANTVTITSVTSDPDPNNNTDTASTSIQTQADIAVSKTDSPDPVGLNGNITYAITLTNNGPSDAQSVVLTDSVPAGTTFVSAMQNSGPAFVLTTPPVGGTGSFTATVTTLAAGATAVFQMVVQLGGGVPGGSTISNTATAATSTTDPTAANNSATATTGVVSAVPTMDEWALLMLMAAVATLAARSLIRRPRTD